MLLNHSLFALVVALESFLFAVSRQVLLNLADEQAGAEGANVSIRCFATGASQLAADWVGILCPVPFLFAVSRQVLLNCRGMAAPIAGGVSIRCFATGASQLSCRRPTGHRKSFYSLFRDRCFSTAGVTPEQIDSCFYSLFRDRCFSTCRPCQHRGGHVSIRCFATGASQLRPPTPLTPTPRRFYSLFRDRCFSTVHRNARNSGPGFYSLFRDRCFSTQATGNGTRVIETFLFAVSRQVLLNLNERTMTVRPMVSIRCFATGASQRVLLKAPASGESFYSLFRDRCFST